ncbi:MAG: hypothetical protein ACMUIU_18230 [bacterium]
MSKKIILSISETRNKITQLDKLIGPGDVLEVTKKGKPYAIIRLIQDEDLYEKVSRLINSLPKGHGKPESIAENYKKLLY